MHTLNNKGFTIIELIIYIALFSILMTGAFTSAFHLLDGAGRLNEKTVTTVEGNFVLKKLSWLLSSIDPAALPPLSVGGSGCSQTLAVNKTDLSYDPLIRLHTVSGVNYVELLQQDGTYLALTTENASTTCLQFNLISSNPLGVTATTTIDGIDFVITRYVRK